MITDTMKQHFDVILFLAANICPFDKSALRYQIILTSNHLYPGATSHARMRASFLVHNQPKWRQEQTNFIKEGRTGGKNSCCFMVSI